MSGPGLNVLYVCKAVDEASPTVATQVRWIRALASQPGVERVHVLTSRHGRADLPANVTVASFAAGGWPGKIARFLGQAVAARPWRFDLFFVAQGGPYPALLLPFKVLTRTPMFQWKAQPYISPRMRFYARWCDDLVFTATPASFPMAGGKVRVVGHGIDTDQFRPMQGAPGRDLVAVGRISPIKRLDMVIRAVARAGEQHRGALTLDVVGPHEPADEGHRRDLEALAGDLGIGDQVRFLGSVEHDRVPELLAGYRACVNFSETAFDKAAGEAMAAGLPVVTTNSSSIEMMPADLRPRLAAAPHDIDDQAARLGEVAGWDAETRRQVGMQLRAAVVADHGLDRFFEKILAEVQPYLRAR